MSQQNMIWLSLSLFSCKVNWHKILSNAIKPFVEVNTEVNKYLVEFNYMGGENIRLALLTNETEKEYVSQAADAYFKKYFQKASLTFQPVTLPVNKIFMPFPGNTIQYGLYPAKVLNVEEVHNYKASTLLSEIIITALQEVIDDETILTFAFYLQVSLIKEIYQLLGNDIDISEVISSGNFLNESARGEPAATALDLMKEITDDVMKTGRFEGELDWLNSWIDYWHFVLKKESVIQQNKTLLVKNVYQDGVQTIYKHLAINAHKTLLTHFSIKSLVHHFMVNE